MPTNIADALPRLKRLIPRLRGKRIGVLGDPMLDRYLWGTASRLSPEAAGSPVGFVGEKGSFGGAGEGGAHTGPPRAEKEKVWVDWGDEGGGGAAQKLRGPDIS